MISVYVNRLDNLISSIEISGHAGFDEIGYDLVCAGVSSIFIGGLNAIKEIEDFDVKFEKGQGYIKAKKSICEHDSIVLETMVVQLQTIEEKYASFIKVNL